MANLRINDAERRWHFGLLQVTRWDAVRNVCYNARGSVLPIPVQNCSNRVQGAKLRHHFHRSGLLEERTVASGRISKPLSKIRYPSGRALEGIFRPSATRQARVTWKPFQHDSQPWKCPYKRWITRPDVAGTVRSSTLLANKFCWMFSVVIVNITKARLWKTRICSTAR